MLFRYFFVLCFLLIHSTSYAASTGFTTGFKTVGVWNAANEVRVDFNVWYPCHSQPTLAEYGAWEIEVVRFGTNAEGRFPLIILSHDTAALRFSYHTSADFLARRGFVVIAPEHKDDNLYHMPNLFTTKQLSNRIDEISLILELAATHSDINSFIDMERIGILGYGTGATVALMLGGVELDANGWNHYCDDANNSDYCNSWAQRHMIDMLTEVEEWQNINQSFFEPRIKAVMAVTPRYDMFFTRHALNSMRTPLALVETEHTTNIHSSQDIFPPTTHFTLLENANYTSLLSPCPNEIKEDLPELCGTDTLEERIAIHKVFNEQMLNFFLDELGQI